MGYFLGTGPSFYLKLKSHKLVHTRTKFGGGAGGHMSKKNSRLTVA